MITNAFRCILEGAGYRVTTACDGEAALRAYTDDPADVLVSDVDMPNMDGLELVKRLRDINPGLPVVIMTGHLTADEAAIEATGAAAIKPSDARTTIFSKPVGANEILDALRVSLTANYS